MSKEFVPLRQSPASAGDDRSLVPVGNLVQGWRIPEALLVRRPDLAHVNRERVTYVCPTCGVVAPHEVHFGHPEQAGYLRRACACQQRARDERERQQYIETRHTVRRRRTYHWLGVQQDLLASMTFEGFEAHYQPHAFQQARSYVDLWEQRTNPLPNVLFAGSFGTSKTHLVCAIVNDLGSRGHAGLFTTAQDLFQALYAADFARKQQLLDQSSTTPLLVLDDLHQQQEGTLITTPRQTVRPECSKFAAC
ncbi:MAG: ATP-binding protein [Ktedonobacteraceae bacterium]|nr:ATP-binding protein [Ktedonobacteraceae bacterium]